VDRPTAEFQLQFLDYIQRLLDGGGFVATYKYALLMAVADLSVERGDDTACPLPLHARDVAGKFVDYYLRQARPYMAGSSSAEGILHQNTGRQAGIVNLVREAIPNYEAGGVHVGSKKLQRDKQLIGKVASTVATMPLWKLQTIGGQIDDFLYENKGRGREFELRPGIAFCFRKFHGFIYRMAQDGWLRFVRERRQNQALLGERSDLAHFMFGADRASLKPYREILDDLQKGRCFYCDSSRSVGHVDHFIPWSWYSLDLGHNFVLACEACNGKKSDMLAASEHLQRWMSRNDGYGQQMTKYFDSRQLPHDRATTLFVARWAYGRVADAGGHTWVQGKNYRRIASDDGWRFPE
jgi:5-methylcytosine-specific restriction endonuclease McrA